MGSSRLPGKVMSKAGNGNTVLDYLINQLKHSKLINKIIIATTTNKQDDIIIEFAKKMTSNFFEVARMIYWTDTTSALKIFHQQPFYELHQMIHLLILQ